MMKSTKGAICDHDLESTVLEFMGKIKAVRMMYQTNGKGRPSIKIKEIKKYKTVKIICKHCSIEWVVPYCRAPKWVKVIMDELNK